MIMCQPILHIFCRVFVKISHHQVTVKICFFLTAGFPKAKIATEIFLWDDEGTDDNHGREKQPVKYGWSSKESASKEIKQPLL